MRGGPDAARIDLWRSCRKKRGDLRVRIRVGRPNIASLVAGWSARRRWRAIAGWLAFVVAAYAVGTAAGQRQLSDVQMGNGESRQAVQIFEDAFPYHTSEQVLVQGTGSIRSTDPAMAGAVQELVARLRSLPTVAQIHSPLDAARASLRSADGTCRSRAADGDRAAERERPPQFRAETSGPQRQTLAGSPRPL
jgi:hypothetical protein